MAAGRARRRQRLRLLASTRVVAQATADGTELQLLESAAQLWSRGRAIYSTSRHARDRLHGALFERELRKVGLAIHYATGAGDPSTPEDSLMIGMQQLWDEFERNRLSRETKRGMREALEQGYRAGGRAPYGYRRRLQELPELHRGPRQAPV